MIVTERLRLLPWEPRHLAPFAAMQADPEVMADQGGPASAERSAAKIGRYTAAYEQFGFCRWTLEDRAGTFVGYAGVMPGWISSPLGPHLEVGWRLVRRDWGKGYASEAARAALDHLFGLRPDAEVLSYTAPDNLRSQAVMARLGLRRDPARDFTSTNDGVTWDGLVWVADKPATG